MAIPLALVAIADLVSKRWVVMSLAPGDRRTLVNGIVSFVYVQNAHGAMGLFGERTGWLVAMALVVVALLAYLLRDGLRRSPYVQIGFGMVAGGALGNVVDRAIHGYVVDFISFWNFYVFNVADAFITIGLAAIVLGSRESRRTAAA